MEIAIKQFRKSMSKSGHEFPTALGHIGWTLVELERYDEAIVEFKKAAKQNSVYILDIAQVYELRNDFVNAQKYYELRLGVLEKDNDPYYKNEIEELKIKIEKLDRKRIYRVLYAIKSQFFKLKNFLECSSDWLFVVND